jgi:hypothetical protein
LSGSTPLPIGEARNGSWVRSMNADLVLARVRHALADDERRSADRSTSSARSTSSGIAWVRGGSGQRANSTASASSTLPVMMSSGMSR